MRSKEEIKILKLRQASKDRLDQIRSTPMVSIQAYRLALVEFQTFSFMLNYYRQLKTA